ncbi:hypothetical protein M413DRAFT_13349 [Hebeloma cylindrosporum]|uniref:Uncharacterized protein n=1 Tax=Hebeloma cylindrosporum TaxID=76867 RepID=A0A0C2Y8P0_HEBCY|nr:hypothetical protein M413DRAFT_13349 [Hebeloma cylindrosporum h7]
MTSNRVEVDRWPRSPLAKRASILTTKILSEKNSVLFKTRIVNEDIWGVLENDQSSARSRLVHPTVVHEIFRPMMIHWVDFRKARENVFAQCSTRLRQFRSNAVWGQLDWRNAGGTPPSIRRFGGRGRVVMLRGMDGGGKVSNTQQEDAIAGVSLWPGQEVTEDVVYINVIANHVVFYTEGILPPGKHFGPAFLRVID